MLMIGVSSFAQTRQGDVKRQGDRTLAIADTTRRHTVKHHVVEHTGVKGKNTVKKDSIKKA